MATSTRSGVRLYLCVAAVLVVVGLFAAACGGGDAAGPEQTVEKLLAAMENKDIDTVWEILDPRFAEEYTAMGMTDDELRSMLAQQMFSDSMSIEFSDVELATEVSDDGQTAVVTVVGGMVTMVENGETTTMDVKESDEPKYFDLVLRDGAWYWDVMGSESTGDTSADDTTTTLSSGETATTQIADSGEWTTIASLRSTDSPWEGWDGILVSEPFTVTGDARLVFDMPGGGEFDGLVLSIIPADLIPAADDPMGWTDALESEAVPGLSVLAASPTEEISGLDGTYVLLVSSPSGSNAWSLELQVQ